MVGGCLIRGLDHRKNRGIDLGENGDQSTLKIDYVLEAAECGSIGDYLHGLGWLSAEEVLAAERVGDGNMNMTVRIRTNRSTFILKQARPWVVKYPHIPAPVERAAVEAGFYDVIRSTVGVASRMPQLLGFNPDAKLLWLEDLGEAADLMSLYRSGEMSEELCGELTGFLVKLHGTPVPGGSVPLFRNREMRKLNHEHQYDLPLRPANGLNLDGITPGLSKLAQDLAADGKFCSRIGELGQVYLADGPALVHGDYFPGSWLATDRGPKIIDPEFCHLGAPEYDLGVFLAHLELIRARPLWQIVYRSYTGPVDWPLARRFAGAEIMRRLIGVAQLPLKAGLETKRGWLELSKQLVCAG